MEKAGPVHEATTNRGLGKVDVRGLTPRSRETVSRI